MAPETATDPEQGSASLPVSPSLNLDIHYETQNVDTTRTANRGSHRAGNRQLSGDGAELVELPAEPGEAAVEIDAHPVPPVEPKLDVKPVPHPKLRLVNPVPQQEKKAKRASGSTSKTQSNVHPVPHKPKSANDNRLQPPTIPGHKWKPSGKTGWELYTRTASISANGKRSSTGKYLAYYSQKAVEKMHERKTKAVA